MSNLYPAANYAQARGKHELWVHPKTPNWLTFTNETTDWRLPPRATARHICGRRSEMFKVNRKEKRHRRVKVLGKAPSAPEAAYAKSRLMTGFLASLSVTQRTAVLGYEGDDILGDPSPYKGGWPPRAVVLSCRVRQKIQRLSSF